MTWVLYILLICYFLGYVVLALDKLVLHHEGVEILYSLKQRYRENFLCSCYCQSSTAAYLKISSLANELPNELPNGAIIFLDEIDSFAAPRDNEMHEATRRILSVLL
ncbi:hypothetical protein S83_063983 [Arachis hypogaea]